MSNYLDNYQTPTINKTVFCDKTLIISFKIK